MFRQYNLHFRIFIVVAFPTRKKKKKNIVFWPIFLSARKAPPLKNRKLYFYCRLAVSDVFPRQRLTSLRSCLGLGISAWNPFKATFLNGNPRTSEVPSEPVRPGALKTTRNHKRKPRFRTPMLTRFFRWIQKLTFFRALSAEKKNFPFSPLGRPRPEPSPKPSPCKLPLLYKKE